MQLGRLPLYQLSYSRTTLVLTTSFEVNGGGRRIRTFEAFATELQSAPLWPLGNPTTSHLFQRFPLLFTHYTLRWCRHTDSNCGPTDYKSVALPTELCRLFLSISYVSYRNGVQFSKTLNRCKWFFQKKP